MASSDTEICNLTISHLGSGKEISNLETEKSEEATVCRRFYTQILEETLRAFPWPFATSIAPLGLVANNPNSEWAYSYRYPSDCLKIRRVLSGVRNDNRQSRVPYKIAQDATGTLIFCDLANAEIEYTIRTTDTARFPADFVTAFSFHLAFFIAPRITAGDPFHMGDRAMKLYVATINKAMAAAINEEQIEEEPDSEFIRGRL